MTTDPDYLSDEDCDRMVAEFLRSYSFENYEDAIRAAWSARPESARRLDEMAYVYSETDDGCGDPENETPVLVTANLRGRHLLEGSTKQKGAGK